jgi:quercetin dioxygenase-like cupin family protein
MKDENGRADALPFSLQQIPVFLIEISVRVGIDFAEFPCERGITMRLALIGLSLCILAFAVTTPLPTQGQDQMPYASMASSKFMNLPMLPSCMTLSAQHGDPMKGPAILLIKFTSGCVVPWHWHTADENLMMVSGKGKAEMKSGGSHPMAMGDYIFLEGRQTHQFTCTSSCMLFDVIGGAFDIHYVSADGTEIPPDQALKPMAKAGAMKKP